VSRRFSDFLTASSIFNSNHCSRSVLAKKWRLSTQLAAGACKICKICNCTLVAASCMLFVLTWPPVACNMNKISRNLHPTGGHVGTICMQLVATGVQFASDWQPLGCKTRDKQTRGVHHNYIFLALASSHPRRMLPHIQLTALGYLVWKMSWYYT